MSIHVESFEGSQHRQFTQSEHLMRVCGVTFTVEVRSVSYKKSWPYAFRPLFDNPDGTLTGKDLLANQLRRWRTATAYAQCRLNGWEYDESDPDLLICEWDNTETVSIGDTLNEATNVATAGGNKINLNNYNQTSGWTMYTTGVDKFGDLDTGYPNFGYWDGESLGGPESDLWSVFSLSSKTASSVSFTIDNYSQFRRMDQTVYMRDDDHVSFSESLSDEINFADEITTMSDALHEMDSVLETLWSTPLSSGKAYHLAITFDRFPAGINPPFIPFNPADFPGSWTGDEVDTYSYASGQAPAERTYIEYSWGLGPLTPTTDNSIQGQRMQWRANQEIEYCVIEFIADFTSGGGFPVVIHTECASATAGQIVDVPLGKMTGSGKVTYNGTNEALKYLSTVRVFFGKTATQVLKDWGALQGTTYYPVSV